MGLRELCPFNYLPRFYGCEGRFVSYLIANRKDAFSCDETHLWNRIKLQTKKHTSGVFILIAYMYI